MLRALAGSLLALACAVVSSPVLAREKVDCAIATGIGTRACTFPEGQIVVEVNVIDWTVDRGSGVHMTSVQALDTLVHIGVGKGLEAQVGVTLFDHERTLMPGSGKVMSSNGVGDLLLGGKVVLLAPEDHPIGVALQPAVVIPLDALRSGSTGLGGRVTLPISYDLNDKISFELTPAAELSGNRGGSGRHLDYGGTLGLAWTMDKRFSSSLEYSLTRELDPTLTRTKQVLAASLGWLPSTKLQLNVGMAVGVSRKSPRSELIIGFARHFR